MQGGSSRNAYFLRECPDLEVASALSVLGTLADTIDQDVIVRHG